MWRRWAPDRGPSEAGGSPVGWDPVSEAREVSEADGGAETIGGGSGAADLKGTLWIVVASGAIGGE